MPDQICVYCNTPIEGEAFVKDGEMFHKSCWDRNDSLSDEQQKEVIKGVKEINAGMLTTKHPWLNEDIANTLLNNGMEDDIDHPWVLIFDGAGGVDVIYADSLEGLNNQMNNSYEDYINDDCEPETLIHNNRNVVFSVMHELVLEDED